MTDMATAATGVATLVPEGKTGDGKLWLSNTQMGTIKKCWRAWYMSKVMRRPSPPSLYAIMGKVAHRLIQDDLTAFMDDGGQFSLRELQSRAPAAFDDMLEREDPYHVLTPDQTDYFRLRLLDCLRLYVEKARPGVANFEAGIIPIAVERTFNFLHPQDDSIRLVGAIDVVTERTVLQDGKRVKQRTMRDWKFIGKPWPKHKEAYDEQPDCYLMAMHHGHVLDDLGDPLPMRAIFGTFPLRQDLKDGEPPMHTLDWRVAERTPQQITRYSDRVLSVAGQIREKLASPNPYNEFTPKPQPLCRFCDHIRSCDVGLREVARSGKPIMTPELPADVSADNTPVSADMTADVSADI